MLRRSLVRSTKAAILGAAGGIGQPLSLLLKTCPMLDELALYDRASCNGLATDLSHISTPAKVTFHGGGPDGEKEGLKAALHGADVVIITAGVARKPGMTRDDLFQTNASIVQGLAKACGDYCPTALLGIVTNPINSVVPIAAETLKNFNHFDPDAQLFGITTLDVTRAKTFIGEAMKMPPADVVIPVIGGHSGPTIVPLLSQCSVTLRPTEIEPITKRVQYGGDEVVKAKNGAGSATHSTAFAAAEFTFSLLKALRGDTGIVECAYVPTNIFPDLPFFAGRVEIGKRGAERVLPIGNISEFENKLIEKCVADLRKDIAKGIEFAKKK